MLLKKNVGVKFESENTKNHLKSIGVLKLNKKPKEKVYFKKIMMFLKVNNKLKVNFNKMRLKILKIFH